MFSRPRCRLTSSVDSADYGDRHARQGERQQRVRHGVQHSGVKQRQQRDMRKDHRRDCLTGKARPECGQRPAVAPRRSGFRCGVRACCPLLAQKRHDCLPGAPFANDFARRGRAPLSAYLVRMPQKASIMPARTPETRMRAEVESDAPGHSRPICAKTSGRAEAPASAAIGLCIGRGNR
jgi:hypothetical protein